MGRIVTDPDALDVVSHRRPVEAAVSTEDQPLVLLGPGKDAQTAIYADQFGRLRSKLLRPQNRKALGTKTAEFVLDVALSRAKDDARRLLGREIRTSSRKTA